jgi:hypothetical protein
MLILALVLAVLERAELAAFRALFNELMIADIINIP